jgi:hypothetical protein
MMLWTGVMCVDAAANGDLRLGGEHAVKKLFSKNY